MDLKFYYKIARKIFIYLLMEMRSLNNTIEQLLKRDYSDLKR